jgi:hypothetical protein
MPPGVFAAITEEDPDPSRIVQLTVREEGILAGMHQNTVTDVAILLEGMVESETGKVALKPAEREHPLVETGLYNLIEDEAPALVYFDAETVREKLLIRLERSEEENSTE